MTGDIAHVCNRGVEKRKIFLDNRDYERFVNNLYLLNNRKGKLRTERVNIFENIDAIPKQDKLVEVLKWSLLPNHYHLLLYEVSEGGILEFTKRVGNAYTKYFNLKNKGRSGYLFQNSAKIIPIENEKHFLYIPLYIDLNPLDLIYPNWETNPVRNETEALDFMRSYKWASGFDYSYGRFEALVHKEKFYEVFDTTPGRYKKEVIVFLRDYHKTPVNLPG